LNNVYYKLPKSIAVSFEWYKISQQSALGKFNGGFEKVIGYSLSVIR